VPLITNGTDAMTASTALRTPPFPLCGIMMRAFQ
jgi:hypothetical protein